MKDETNNENKITDSEETKINKPFEEAEELQDSNLVKSEEKDTRKNESNIEGNSPILPNNIQMSRTERFKDKKPKKKNIIFFGTILGIFALLFLFILCFVQNQMDNNTKLIKDKLQTSIHYIDLYEVTQEDGYLIYLYGELKEIDTLLNQTTNLGIAVPSFTTVFDEGALQVLVDNEIKQIEKVVQKEEPIKQDKLLALRYYMGKALYFSHNDDTFNSFIRSTNDSILCKD